MTASVVSGVFAMIAAAAVVFLGFTTKHYMDKCDELEVQAEMWKASAQDATASLDTMHKALINMDYALNEHRNKVDSLRRERNTLNKLLKEALNNDKDVKEWSAAPLPGAVRSMLENGGSTGDQGADGAAAESSDAADR